ncbi:unnamed protein product [Cylindrotheca closterium]|uniref:Uncharacterized protein n=1 Tax=Cylindrotheca closterium TaxID=2856 RepID=A0AAD2G9Q0_9STRA|nr:unnamed protein product [Cylindrotheca closterium]
MKTGNKDVPGKADIVFGIRKSKELMEKFPRTTEYFNQSFESYRTAIPKERVIVSEAFVAQAKNWKPPARFFQYNQDTGFHPIDEKQAKDKTHEGLRGMKRAHDRRESTKALSDRPQPAKANHPKPAKVIPKLVSDPKNYVVFAIGNNPKMLEKYPRTNRFRELVHRNFEAHLNGTAERRVAIQENVLEQVYNWDPPGEFWKMHRGHGKISPVDEKHARRETQKVFASLRQEHRKRESKKLEGNVEGSEEDDEISIAPTTTSDIQESNNGDDVGARTNSSRSGQSDEGTPDYNHAKAVDKPSNSRSETETTRTQPSQNSETPHSKKRLFIETASDIDLLETEMKNWDPSSIRYKLRKRFLARTIVVKL